MSICVAVAVGNHSFVVVPAVPSNAGVVMSEAKQGDEVTFVVRP